MILTANVWWRGRNILYHCHKSSVAKQILLWQNQFFCGKPNFFYGETKNVACGKGVCKIRGGRYKKKPACVVPLLSWNSICCHKVYLNSGYQSTAGVNAISLTHIISDHFCKVGDFFDSICPSGITTDSP